ncbi:hypothetical protein R9X47_21845 [Wukongibacter baidiensis]|uniref:hypothetical protein n=1 Tax=Wukongibacter baidiensis TaxID=1723361 RepID=UPI003D7F501C
MTLDLFQNRLISILDYVNKLNRENLPLTTKRLLLKAYANDLNINLTSSMIFEILSYSHISYSNYQIH